MKFYNILIDRATKEQNQLILPLLKDFSQPYKTFLFNIIRRIINENQGIQATFLTLLNDSIMDYQHEIGWLRTVPEDISNFMCYKFLDYISDYYTMCIEEPQIIERDILYQFIVFKIKIENYLSHPINSYRSQIKEITQKLTYDMFRGSYSFKNQLERVLGEQYQLISSLDDQQNYKQYKFSLEWFQKLEKKKKKSYLKINNSNFGLKDYRLFLINQKNKRLAQEYQIQQVIFIDELDHILKNLLKLDCKPQNITRYTSYRNNLKQSSWVDIQLDPLLSTDPQFNKYIYFYKYYKIYLNKKDTLTIRKKFHQFLGEIIQASPFNKGRFKKSRFVQNIITKILQQKNLTNFYKILFHYLTTFVQKFDKLIVKLLRLLIVECQRLLVHYFKFRFSIHYFMFLIIVQLNLPKQELESNINKVFDIIANATYKDIQVENYLDILIKQISLQKNFIKEQQNYQTLHQLDFTFKNISNSLLDTIILFKSKLGNKLLNIQAFIEIEFINLTNETTFIPPHFNQNIAKKLKNSSILEYYQSFQEYREKLCQLCNVETKTFRVQNQYMIDDANNNRIKYERNLDSLQKYNVAQMSKQEVEYFNINEKMVKYLNMILNFEIKKSQNKYFKHLLIFIQKKFYIPNKFVLFLKMPLRITRWINYNFGTLFIQKFERQLYLMIVGGDIYRDLLLYQYEKKQTLELRKQTLSQQYQMALNVIKHFQSMDVLLDFKLVLLPIIKDKTFFDSFPTNDDINSYHFNFCCFLIKLLTNIYSDNCIKTEAGFEMYMRFMRKQVEIKEINILTEYKSLILSENELVSDDLIEIMSQQFSAQKLCQQVIQYKKNNNMQLNDQEKLFKIKTLVQQRTRNLKKKQNKVLFIKFYRKQIKKQTSLNNILYILQVPNSETIINLFVDKIKKYVFHQMGIQYYDPCPLNVIRLNLKIQQLETKSPDEISHQIQQGFLTFMKGFINKIIYVSQTQRSGDEINIHQTKTQVKAKDKFEKKNKQCIIIDDSEIEEIDEIEQLMKMSQSYQICEINKIDPLQLDKLQSKQEQIHRNNFQLDMMRMERNQMERNQIQMSEQDKCKMNVNLLLQQKHQKYTNQYMNERLIQENNQELYDFIDRKKEKYNNNQKNRQISLQNKLQNPTKRTIQISLQAVLLVLREDYKDIFKEARFLKYNYY